MRAPISLGIGPAEEFKIAVQLVGAEEFKIAVQLVGDYSFNGIIVWAYGTMSF